MLTGEQLRQALRQQGLRLGFDTIGVTAADAIPQAKQRLWQYLEAGYHGDMQWLETKAERRQAPQDLWPDCKSVVMVAMNYGPAQNPLSRPAAADDAVISVYAQPKDYHDVLKKRLKQLARWFVAETGAQVKVFVDTAPVMEKPLAAAAGIGWQGKHTNLVSREYGSWLFLGAMFTDYLLPGDNAAEDRCGQCQRCLDICPTNAFPAPYVLDARRCIAYLTIEHQGAIPRALRAGIGNRIFGCDDCLAVCPWNKFARQARDIALHPKPDLTQPYLSHLLALDEAGFRAKFAGTPVRRLGYVRFLRNLLIAAGNSGEVQLQVPVKAYLTHAQPVVRAMAVWALAQLLAAAEFQAVRQHYGAQESDAAVRAEWAQ